MNAKSRRPSTNPSTKSIAHGATKRHAGAKPAPARPPVVAAPDATVSKQARLIDMLRSPKGGTIEQLTKLTGWQAHTVRGTVSGVLRKRLKLNVVCSPATSGPRVYRIVEMPT